MRWLHIVSALFRDGGPSGIVINTGRFEHIGFAIFAIEAAGALVRGVLPRRLIIQAALRARKQVDILQLCADGWQVLSVIAPGLRRPRRRTGDRWRRGWLSVSLARRDLEAGGAQQLNDDFGRLCGVKDLRRTVAAAEEIGQNVLRGELAHCS